MTVALLLEELDTVPDLVSCLACKEAFISTPGVVVSVPGEEEILARYMLTMRDGQHALPATPKDASFFGLPEGDWVGYADSPQRAAKRRADEVSYLWDSIIEHHSQFLRAGSAVSIPEQPPDQVQHERIVRAMASQNRVVRRQCGSDLHYVLSRDDPLGVFARIHMTGRPPDRAFVFLAAKRRNNWRMSSTARLGCSSSPPTAMQSKRTCRMRNGRSGERPPMNLASFVRKPASRHVQERRRSSRYLSISGISSPVLS
jgi:hypothetical protein